MIQHIGEQRIVEPIVISELAGGRTIEITHVIQLQEFDVPDAVIRERSCGGYEVLTGTWLNCYQYATTMDEAHQIADKWNAGKPATYNRESDILPTHRHAREYWTGGDGFTFENRERCIEYVEYIGQSDMARQMQINDRDDYESACRRFGVEALSDEKILDSSYAWKYGEWDFTTYGISGAVRQILAERRWADIRPEETPMERMMEVPTILTKQRGQLWQPCLDCGSEPVCLGCEMCEDHCTCCERSE